MNCIELSIVAGGDISLGAACTIEPVATATDPHNSIAMLVRRADETLNELLRRVDRAVGRFYDRDEIIDEVSSP